MVPNTLIRPSELNAVTDDGETDDDNIDNDDNNNGDCDDKITMM